MIERLTQGDGMDRRGHEFRYHLAAGFVGKADTVLDAACGAGYGIDFLNPDDYVDYYGVDRDLSAVTSDYLEDGRFIQADLDTWVPDFGFDVFVSFETLEHVEDPEHLIDIGSLAREWMIMSVPIVPTKHVNPYHLHDFEMGWLEMQMAPNPDWEHYQTVQQPSEVSEISVFRRVQ